MQSEPVSTKAGGPWWAEHDACLEYIFKARFGDLACGKCGRRNRFYRNAKKPCYTCACGRCQVFPMKGTLFGNSPLPLPKWFQAGSLMVAAGGGIAASTLQRTLGVTYATAWRMRGKLSARLPEERPFTLEQLLANCIAADEGYRNDKR